MTAPPHDDATRGEVFDEAATAIGAPPLYGPPVIFLLGPWLLLVLLLIPPAALLLTIGLVLIVVTAPATVLVAVPYLLVRRLRARREAHLRRSASAPAPARRRVPAGLNAKGPRGSRPVGAHLVPLRNK